MVSIKATQQTVTLDPRAYRLPDIPEKHPDDMTSSNQLAKGGNQGRLEFHLGEPNIVVFGERFICAAPRSPVRYPDLAVARNRRPSSVRGQQRLYRIVSGKAARLRTGNSV